MTMLNSMFLQIAALKHVVKSGSVAAPNAFMRISNRLNNVCLYSTTANPNISTESGQKKVPQRKMSKAMLAYLERAKAHDEFLKKERKDYHIGKRHLANMMGEDPSTFTQADVEKAIEYLFPSGIYDKKARPVMKPPEEIFPPRKEAEFDETGRPYHSMFYTTRPNYYQALHDCVEHMQKLKDLEDNNIRNGVPPKPEDKMDLSKSEWFTLLHLEKVILEKITEFEYEYFITSFQRLADHPYSQHVEEFLMKFRKQRVHITQSLITSELEYDADGRPFITVKDCLRKSARGIVTVKGKGSGKIIINGKPMIQYFPDHQEREQVRSFLVI